MTKIISITPVKSKYIIYDEQHIYTSPFGGYFYPSSKRLFIQ